MNKQIITSSQTWALPFVYGADATNNLFNQGGYSINQT